MKFKDNDLNSLIKLYNEGKVTIEEVVIKYCDNYIFDISNRGILKMIIDDVKSFEHDHLEYSEHAPFPVISNGVQNILFADDKYFYRNEYLENWADFCHINVAFLRLILATPNIRFAYNPFGKSSEMSIIRKIDPNREIDEYYEYYEFDKNGNIVRNVRIDKKACELVEIYIDENGIKIEDSYYISRISEDETKELIDKVKPCKNLLDTLYEIDDTYNGIWQKELVCSKKITPEKGVKGIIKNLANKFGK